MHRTIKFGFARYGFGLMMALSATALAACGSEAPTKADGPLGSVHAALNLADVTHDVSRMAYKIVAAGSDCSADALAESTVSLEEEALPGSVQPAGGGDNHPFSDALFVLAPGDYHVCVTPLAGEGPSKECAAAEADVSVVAGETTEVLLVSQCEGDPNGGLDVIAALNDPPQIDDLDIRASKFITKCEEATIVVAASDPNGDALSYAWAVTSGPGGSVSGSANEATFTPTGPGDYEVTVTVTDVYDASTSLEFPIHVSDAECGGAVCELVNGVNWCYNENACGEACEQLCASIGRSLTIANTTWFEAQDTEPECQAIADAFGMPGIIMASWTYGCLEDDWGTHSAPGGLNGRLFCSTYVGCPQEHRTLMDQQGEACGESSGRRSLCPCD